MLSRRLRHRRRAARAARRFERRRVSHACCAAPLWATTIRTTWSCWKSILTHQKTLCDFLRHRAHLRRAHGRLQALREAGQSPLLRPRRPPTPVERIYNRAIVDELERRATSTLPFDFRDDLAVEWAGHPNWFFRLSKFSLPYLRHRAVPRTQFLDRVECVGKSRALRAQAALFVCRAGRDCGADTGGPCRRPGCQSEASFCCRSAWISRR